MTEQIQEQQATALIPLGFQQLLRIILVGAIVGVVTWGVTLLLDAYLFKGMICQGADAVKCATSLTYSSVTATLLAAGLGLLGLVKLQVFRALLVVIGATISLWGLQSLLNSWTWPGAVLASLLLFAIAYSLFAWLARLRSFLLAVIIIVVIVVVVRLALNA